MASSTEKYVLEGLSLPIAIIYGQMVQQLRFCVFTVGGTGLIYGWGTVIMLCATVKTFGLPMWLIDKELARNAGDLGSVPGLGRSPGEGNGNPLLYSCLGSPMDRGTWRATVHGVAKSQT